MKRVVFLLSIFISTITLHGQDYATYLSPYPPPKNPVQLTTNQFINQSTEVNGGTDITLSDDTTKTFSEVYVAVNPNNPEQIAISSNVNYGKHLVQSLFYTNDGGITWQKHSILPVDFANQWCDPSIAFDNNGNFYVSTLIPFSDTRHGSVSFCVYGACII